MKISFFIFLFILMTGAQARNWRVLQVIAENEYLGKDQIKVLNLKATDKSRFASSKKELISLDSPIAEVHLTRTRNPFVTLGHAISSSVSPGDQDTVEIRLISETRLTAVDCYYKVYNSIYLKRKSASLLYACETTVLE